MIKKTPPTAWEYNAIRSKSKVKQFLGHFKFGLRSNIRLCCIIQFCILVVAGVKEMAKRSGCSSKPECQYAHCIICQQFH